MRERKNSFFILKIIFENIRTNLNSVEIIRKYLATQFNFIFSLKKGDSFKIMVNGKEITKKDLEELDKIVLEDYYRYS